MRNRFPFPATTAMAALLVSFAAVSPAQNSCQQFRAATPLAWDNKLASYTGPVYAMLGDEMLVGKAVPGDTPTSTTCDDLSCQDTGGTVRFIFRDRGLMDPGDSITIKLHTAVYTLPGGFGIYHATEEVVGGTGRFQNATGLLFESGPFVAWMDDKGEIQAQYNGEIGGSICAATAKQTASPSVKPAAPALIFPFPRRELSPSRRK